jgi:hypothetical protein
VALRVEEHDLVDAQIEVPACARKGRARVLMGASSRLAGAPAERLAASRGFAPHHSKKNSTKGASWKMRE